MTLVVFAGPSLGAEALEARDGFEMRPPAACGDIARAVRQGVRAIGLVDGLFETTPAPWPKEVLWVLERGIPVFGAASMGALRAVELAPYGMIGIGRIFLDYVRGRLADDDEVAVLHGPREAGYPAITEAMVNIRATLARAKHSGVIDGAALRILLAAAKDLFFKQRTYESVLRSARRLGLRPEASRRLSAWLPGNAVDIKRRDARALLESMRMCPGNRPAKPTRVVLTRTAHWRSFCARYDIVDRAPRERGTGCALIARGG